MKILNNAFWALKTTRFVLLLMIFVSGTFISLHMFERILLNQVQAVAEVANVVFTRIFVNEAWQEIGPKLDLPENVKPSDNPFLLDVDMRVRRFAKGTDLVKVKIYNIQGMTIYSSDPKQIGEDKSSNKGFQTASRGRVASETTYRGKFGAFDGEVFQRNLVSSYVPVKIQHGIVAVAEIYADRTTSIDAAELEVRRVRYFFIPGMGIAFVLVWLLVQLGSRNTEKNQEGLGQKSSLSNVDVSAQCSPEVLLQKAVDVLSVQRNSLASALKTQGDLAPDPTSWQKIHGILNKLLLNLEVFVLAQDPTNANHREADDSHQSLCELVDRVATEFRENHQDQKVDLGIDISSVLDSRKTGVAPLLTKLMRMMLAMASDTLGEGHLRFRVYLDANTDILIEIIGTYPEINSGEQLSGDNFDGLKMCAVTALADALNGHVVQASISPRGPWLSVSVPAT